MRRLFFYSLSTIFIATGIAYVFYAKFGLIYVSHKNIPILNYCSESNEYNDIIYIGGSRVKKHINTEIVDSVNEIKSYCIAVAGIGIVECNLLLDKYLQNHPKPKTVFLNIDWNMFATDAILYNITDYFSYLDDKLIYDCISPYKLVYRSKIVQQYYYMQKLFANTDETKAVHLHFEKVKPPPSYDTIDYRGYHPSYDTWDAEADLQLSNKIKADYQSIGFDLLKKMIERCKQDSINIILINSPIYCKAPTTIVNESEILDKIKSIATDANIPYWDYSGMQICKSKDFFADMVHLNIKGSIVFSRQFASDIKRDIYGNGRH